jgi:hypothetical protein
LVSTFTGSNELKGLPLNTLATRKYALLENGILFKQNKRRLL